MPDLAGLLLARQAPGFQFLTHAEVAGHFASLRRQRPGAERLCHTQTVFAFVGSWRQTVQEEMTIGKQGESPATLQTHHAVALDRLLRRFGRRCWYLLLTLHFL